jgi:uncharacterized membrane protein YqaE (UPF0057 family)
MTAAVERKRSVAQHARDAKSWETKRRDNRPSRDFEMRLLVALILPWLTFFTIGKPISGLICLILQITVIGWLPATIWAVYALGQYKTDKKIEKALAHRM